MEEQYFFYITQDVAIVYPAVYGFRSLPSEHDPTNSQVTPVLECLDGERLHIGSQDLSLRLQNASRIRQSRLVECGKG